MDKRKADELIKSLPGMDRPAVAELWEEYFGHAPASTLRIDLLRPILAYRIQERQRGPLLSEMQRRLSEAMKAYSPNSKANQVGRYKAGIRIVREWGGVIHEVQVTDEGYVYLGETYKSLSPIANHITGTRWSGPCSSERRQRRWGNALVKPELLAWARGRASVTMEDAASAAHTNVADVQAWETGKNDAAPTLAQLRLLAAKYHFPLAVFYLPQPPLVFSPLRDFRRIDGPSTNKIQPIWLFIPARHTSAAKWP